MQQDQSEDIEYLREWIVRVRNHAVALNQRAKQNGRLSVFTISSTTKVPERKQPYLTPLRPVVHGCIGGAVVFSQTQAILVCAQVDGLVDMVLVDAEKKMGIQFGQPSDILAEFGMEIPYVTEVTRVYVDMGNLSAACANHIKKSRFQEFKPNDITVEAVWLQLTSHFKVLSGRRFAIIGVGNIGFKLALKLVESGSTVEIVRRDLSRGMLMADVINIVKPQSTLAISHFNPDPMQACLFSDAIIGCTGGNPVIRWEMVQGMKKNGILIDVGKGSFYVDAVKNAIQNGVPIYRCDVTSSIDGLIASVERNRVHFSQEMGRAKCPWGGYLISGGHMGLAGDIIVDHYQKPTRILGVSDGAGDMKRLLSEEDKQNIRHLEERMDTPKTNQKPLG